MKVLWCKKLSVDKQDLVNPCKNIESVFPSHSFLRLFKSLLKTYYPRWLFVLWFGLRIQLLGLKLPHRFVYIYRHMYEEKSANCLFHILFNVSGEPFAGFGVVDVLSGNRYLMVLSEVSKNGLLLLCAILQFYNSTISIFLVFTTSCYVNLSF